MRVWRPYKSRPVRQYSAEYVCRSFAINDLILDCFEYTLLLYGSARGREHCRIYYLSPVKRICVFEHSVMTNFNCACPAIQLGQGSGFLSQGSSWFTACMSEQRRFWRDCADAQARLNLRCSHRRLVPNSLDAVHFSSWTDSVNPSLVCSYTVLFPSFHTYSVSAVLRTEPRHVKTNKMSVHPAKTDQPGHPPSLIRVFAVRLKNHWVLSYPFSAQRRLWSDWADDQADLSLRWAHTHFVDFFMSRLNLLISIHFLKGLSSQGPSWAEIQPVA